MKEVLVFTCKCSFGTKVVLGLGSSIGHNEVKDPSLLEFILRYWNV